MCIRDSLKTILNRSKKAGLWTAQQLESTVQQLEIIQSNHAAFMLHFEEHQRLERKWREIVLEHLGSIPVPAFYDISKIFSDKSKQADDETRRLDNV